MRWFFFTSALILIWVGFTNLYIGAQCNELILSSPLVSLSLGLGMMMLGFLYITSNE